MPRVKTVNKARKSPGSCSKCGKKLEAGQSYRWWKFRYGGKRFRCTNAACSPRQSDLTTSDKLSRCYAAGESIEDAISEFQKNFDLEDLRGAMEGAAGELREVAEEYRESASNVESGMNGNRMPICDELEEKADNLDSKADEIESAASELEDFDEDRAKEEAEADLEAEQGVVEGEAAEQSDDDRETEIKKLIDEKKEEWVEEQAAKAEEFTDLSPEG